MALVSPGVQVSITDESFFSSSGPGTVPLIMIATKQDKLTPDGSGIASGTTAANADKLYLVASQRELLQTFGDPDFNEIGGTAQNGYPLNEYGLLAAYSYLGAANRAYVVRADIDLAELDASSTEPTTSPADGAYWLDTVSSTAGLFVWSTVSNSWTQVSLSGVIVPPAAGDTSNDIADNAAAPAGGYQNGDIIMNLRSDGVVKFLERVSGAWQTLGNGPSRSGGADFQWGPSAAEPTVKSDGTTLDGSSYWLNTSTINSGLDLVVSHYDSSLGQFVSDPVANVETFKQLGTDIAGPGTPLRSANNYYDRPDVNANSVTAGTVVGFVDSNAAFNLGTSESRPLSDQNTGGLGTAPGDGAFADVSLLIHNGGTTTTITTGTIPSLVFTAGDVFQINGANVTDLVSGGTAGTYADIEELVIFLNADPAIIAANVQVSANTAGDGLTFTCTSGVDIAITIPDDAPTSSTLTLADLGLTTTTNFDTNFETFSTVDVATQWTVQSSLVTSYDVGTTAPTQAVPDGTYWYDPSFTVDLLVNGGNNTWQELPDDLFIQSDEPTTGTTGDIWVETDDVDNYPKIYRFRNSAWELVDNTDQTTSLGIVFADARATENIPDPIVADADATNTLDTDAPDPGLYPGGTLLWNTRHSGRNVKVWTENATALSTAPTVPVDRWVSASGNNQDGSLRTGQAAQKAVVVEKLAEVLVGNEEIRDDTIFYNLIAAPGFPELIDEMITLNVDRKEQAFVIGDSPFDLSNSTTELQAWASNSNNAAGNGDDGLVTADTYLGVYYPSGLSTNVDGNEVVVPPSHMVLRVMATNDQTAYPWYAPAGFSRGTVTNATSVGYLNSSDEFVPVSLTQGQRDVLQLNNVNPIANIPNRGLVVFGQKTRQATASALDRVNVARLVNYIRYQADQLAQPFLFEPNDSVTRNIVKDAFDSFLAELVTLRGLNDFLVVVDESNNTPARIDANELWIDIAIQPIKSVEFIFIPIRIRNTGDDLNL